MKWIDRLIPPYWLLLTALCIEAFVAYGWNAAFPFVVGALVGQAHTSNYMLKLYRKDDDAE